MGIPKKGSRKITVDGESFIWLIRREPTYFNVGYEVGCLNVAVEHAEGIGSKLVIMAEREVMKDGNLMHFKPVIPSEVASWISQAIKAGWEPKKSGKPFELVVTS
ncbi:MAG: hypothetical protein AAF915_24950 [Cyanobacteria bacterium P01_D01_bin.50]